MNIMRLIAINSSETSRCSGCQGGEECTDIIMMNEMQKVVVVGDVVVVVELLGWMIDGGCAYWRQLTS